MAGPQSKGLALNLQDYKKINQTKNAHELNVMARQHWGISG